MEDARRTSEKLQMLKLQGMDIYLAMLEREDCKTIWNDMEYDFTHPTEELNIGHSDEKADDWFDEIQKLQREKGCLLSCNNA